jgi:iron complex outermembrane receptor protein
MRNGTGEFTTARQWGPRVSKASRPFLALATGILVIVSGDVAAQNPRDAVAADKPDGLDEVVVTGSRIARPVLDLPTPVGVVSAESLAGNNLQFDIGRALAQQPSIGFSGSLQQNQQSGAAGTRGETSGGLSTVDLRSLGTNRTLVLVDGKRRIAGTTDSAAVDLNSINPGLIERVEIITGGASAIYGSDAVSGVVNVITKRRFDGVMVSLDGSRPTESTEGLTTGGSVIAGRNFGADRGNVTIAANYAKVDAITPRRADMNNYDLMNNPANTGPNDGIPNQIVVPNSETFRFAGDGIVGVRNETRGLGVFMFNPDGTTRRPPTPIYTDGGLFGVYDNCGVQCFRFDDSIQVVPDIERYNVNARLSFEFTDSAEAYLAVDYNDTASLGVGQPVQQSAIAINVAQNAYLNNAFRQQLLGAGVATLQLDRSFFDVGLRSSRVDRDSVSVVGGVKGTLANDVSDLSYDLYATYGRTEATFTGFNRVLTANYRAAFDAVVDPADQRIKCRMDVPALQPMGYVRPVTVGSAACAPFNPFGAGASSQAARDFVRATTVSTAFVKQFTAGLSVSGDTGKFLTMPGGDAISFAVGAEYRDERNGRVNDPLVRQGLTTQAVSQDYEGGFDVSEVFAEASVPLLKDRPLAELLSIEGAVRHASYSTAGGVTSWKGGAIWEPVSGLRLRGTVGRAIRAPNIFEGFRPSEGQTTNIQDPCSQQNLSLNPNRPANCSALGRPAGFVPVNGGLGIQFNVSGNQDLVPETSDSWTVGLVVSPSFLPGLQVTLDWYDISIKDAVSFLTGQEIANNCVDRTGGPDPALCSLLVRESNPASPNFFAITGGRSTYVNTSKVETSGLDLQVFYATQAGSGRLSANLFLNYIERFRAFTFQARPEQFRVWEGFLGFPRYKGVAQLNYEIGPVKLGWQGRYQSSQSLTDRSPGISRELAFPGTTGSRFYHDVSASYSFDFGPGRDATASLGVTNLANAKLPLMEGTQAISATAGGFDQFGPVVRAGLQLTF